MTIKFTTYTFANGACITTDNGGKPWVETPFITEQEIRYWSEKYGKLVSVKTY